MSTRQQRKQINARLNEIKARELKRRAEQKRKRLLDLTIDRRRLDARVALNPTMDFEPTRGSEESKGKRLKGEPGKFSVIVNAAGNEAEVHLDGPIGGLFGISSRAFNVELNDKAKNVDRIRLLINSGGGDLFEAIAIYHALAEHKAEVIAEVRGVAASAATLILQAADTRRIAKNAFFMVHEVRGGVWGTERDVKSYLKLLQNANEAVQLTYADRAGRSVEDIATLLDHDNWMKPKEARDEGLVDEITAAKSVKPAVEPNSKLSIDWSSLKDEADFQYAQSNVAALVAMVRADDDEDDQEEIDADVELEEDPEADEDLDVDDDVDDEDEDADDEEDDTAAASTRRRGKRTRAAATLTGDDPVGFKAWLQAKGINASKLTAAQLDHWKSVYNGGNTGGDGASHLDNLDKSVANTIRRHEKIRQKCGANFQELAADAIENNWSDDLLDAKLEAAKNKAELEKLKPSDSTADFGGGFAIHSHQSPQGSEAQELMVAALCLGMNVSIEDLMDPFGGLSRTQRQQLGLPNIRPMSEQTIEKSQRYFNGIGIQEVILFCNRMEKTDTAITWNHNTSIQNSFSTVTVPAILHDSLERAMIAGFNKAQPKWSRFARARSMRDFKEQTFYRVYGTGRWEKTTPEGTLKHGELKADEVYRLRVETEGQIMFIGREIIVNNDLGSMQDIARMMAMNGRLAPEFAAWELVNENWVDPIINDLDWDDAYNQIKELWKAWIRATQFDPEDVDKDKLQGLQTALDMEAGVILCHKIRGIDMQEVINGRAEVTGGGATPEVVSILNALRGVFEICASSYFGAEDKIVLMPGPSVAPALEVGFLNGRQVPFMQPVTPEPNKLGFGVRGWTDIGTSKVDDFLVVTADDIPAPAQGGPMASTGTTTKGTRRVRRKKKSAPPKK